MIQLVFLCIVSLAAARPYAVPSYDSPAYEQVYDSKPEPYSFGFDTKDEYGTTLSRSEEGDELGNKRGSYGFLDPYGIYRQVDYVADDKGFRAVIKTNEPGTESQNPADAEILSEAAPVKYDAPAAYANAPVSAVYARPATLSSPVYAKPALVAPVSPLGYEKSSPAIYNPAPAVYNPAPAIYNSAPAVYSPAPAVYNSAPGVYNAAPEVYDSSPEVYGSADYAPTLGAYSPVSEVYGPTPAAYASSPVYEPQAYGGPSYEQLSDRASQSSEYHPASE